MECDYTSWLFAGLIAGIILITIVTISSLFCGDEMISKLIDEYKKIKKYKKRKKILDLLDLTAENIDIRNHSDGHYMCSLQYLLNQMTGRLNELDEQIKILEKSMKRRQTRDKNVSRKRKRKK